MNDKLENGWHRLTDKTVGFKFDGGIYTYDEPGLRKNLIGFLSDESRARFAPDKFVTEKEYFKHLQWFMEGFELFYKA